MSSQEVERRAMVATPAIPAPQRISQATAVEQSRAVAEVQAAIIVAQQCPRDMQRAWAEMRAACGRLALASRAFYRVSNRGTGPSVHLARELARIWGNIDHGTKELRRDDEQHESEVQAYAWDQQTNVRSTRSMIVPHARMSGGERKPLVDLTDVYLNNQNIAARAVRECLFTVMPADFVAEAQDICRATIEKGDGKPLDQRIADMVAAFAQLGVTVGQIESRLDRRRGMWTASDVADLSVVYASIKRGEISVGDEFGPQGVTAQEIAQQAAAEQPQQPAPADPAPSEPQPTTRKATRKQLDELAGLFAQVEMTDRKDRLQYVNEVLAEHSAAPVQKPDELTGEQAGWIADKLADWAKRLTPDTDSNQPDASNPA